MPRAVPVTRYALDCVKITRIKITRIKITRIKISRIKITRIKYANVMSCDLIEHVVLYSMRQLMYSDDN